jgi:hypothetical protein
MVSAAPSPRGGAAGPRGRGAAGAPAELLSGSARVEIELGAADFDGAEVSGSLTAGLPRCPAAPLGAGRFKNMAGATAMAIISRIAQMVRRSMDQVTDSRDRIEATGMKRVTTGEAPGGEPASAEGAVAADRLQSVLGAGRSEPAARRQQRRHQQLVSTNEGARESPRDQPYTQHGSSSPKHAVTPGEQLGSKLLETRLICLAPSPDQEIARRLVALQVSPPDLPQATP